MEQGHISASKPSTILFVLAVLMVISTFRLEKYSHPVYDAGTNYLANPKQPPAPKRRFFAKNAVGEEKMQNMSGPQADHSSELLLSLLDNKYVTPSSNNFLQMHPLKLMNNSSIPASVKVDLGNSATVPNDLRRLRPKILDDYPSNFLPSYKNPCYIRYSEKQLHCLPYFFLLGTPKSGTTDIWSKIVAHPEIVSPGKKEPHWWTRGSFKTPEPLRVYAQNYMTNNIRAMTEKDIANQKIIVTGDGSASTFWDNSKWKEVYPEYDKMGPPYIIADVIHTVLPDAKLLVTFRDPTTRLYSGYKYFNSDTSPDKFHQWVLTGINKFTTCLAERPLEACAYGRILQEERIRTGLYSVFLRDWMKRYPRKQIMVLKLEEWHDRCTKLLPEIYEFLNVASLSPERIVEICRSSTKHVTKEKKQIGPMLNSTRKILRDFYRPYVVRLASLLNDDRFLWDYDDDHMIENS